MKFKDWLSIWTETYIVPTKKARTARNYKDICELHLLPALGDRELEELTPIVLQRHINDLAIHGNKKTGGGLSANYIGTVICVLQSSLKEARNSGVTDVFHAGQIKRPRVDPREQQPKCFTLKQQRQLEQAVLTSKKKSMLGILIALYTGVRIGELLALTVSSVDIKNRTIAITQTCYEGKRQGGYGRILDTPKTASSCRTIPFPKQLTPIFKSLIKDNKSGFLIENASGKPIGLRSYQKSYSRLIAKLGLPPLSFHKLRDTFATRSVESGMDVKCLSQILGHKSVLTSLNIYTQATMQNKRDSMDKLGRMLQTEDQK